MRFMVMMIPGRKYEEGVLPDPKVMEAMMKFNQELAKAGVLLALDGLQSPSKGARIRFAGGKPSVTDGPFAEATEVIGGYWLWQVASRDEAIAWASRCPAEDGDTLEIRRVFELADFGPEMVEKAAAVAGDVGRITAKNRERP